MQCKVEGLLMTCGFYAAERRIRWQWIWVPLLRYVERLYPPFKVPTPGFHMPRSERFHLSTCSSWPRHWASKTPPGPFTELLAVKANSSSRYWTRGPATCM
jgi:hypothetical protein